MTKKEGGGPYREQGPGVYRQDVAERMFEDLELEIQPARYQFVVRSTLVRSIRVPVTFSVAGKAGEVVKLEQQSHRIFRGEEFFAQDDSLRPGYGTRIVQCFVGHRAQFSVAEGLGIPTWMFYEWVAPEDRKTLEYLAAFVGTVRETPEARAAWASLRIANAAKMTWTTIHPGLPWMWEIRFEETCRWDGVLWGSELTG